MTKQERIEAKKAKIAAADAKIAERKAAKQADAAAAEAAKKFKHNQKVIAKQVRADQKLQAKEAKLQAYFDKYRKELAFVKALKCIGKVLLVAAITLTVSVIIASLCKAGILPDGITKFVDKIVTAVANAFTWIKETIIPGIGNVFKSVTGFFANLFGKA